MNSDTPRFGDVRERPAQEVDTAGRDGPSKGIATRTRDASRRRLPRQSAVVRPRSGTNRGRTSPAPKQNAYSRSSSAWSRPGMT